MKKLQGVLIRIKDETGTAYLPLLSGWKNTQDGHWSVYLNTRIPLWAFLLQGYTRMPVEAFKLSNRAFALCRYLLLLTNMNKKKLQTEGKFSLNMDTLVNRMFPGKDTQYKTRLIATPLEKMIQEINEANLGLHLTVCKTFSKDFFEAKLEVKVASVLLDTEGSKKLLYVPQNGSGTQVNGSGTQVNGSGTQVPSLQVP